MNPLDARITLPVTSGLPVPPGVTTARTLGPMVVMTLVSFLVPAPTSWVRIPAGTYSIGSPAGERCRDADETRRDVLWPDEDPGA